jgi:1-acyl-sn-glycerol-3-phosphate acyltransferase
LLWILSVITVFIFGISLKIRGKLPSGRFILIYNHCSNVDDVLNPIILGRKPWKVMFAEHQRRVPFVRFFLSYVGIPVTREEIDSRLDASEKATSFLKDTQENLLVFPEGRRLTSNEKESLLLRFYSGAFRWSEESDIQIVPVVVYWTFLFQNKEQWWFSSREIEIDYLEPVRIEEGESIKNFSQRVRMLMLEKLRLSEASGR